jgi:hypothetical protein
MIEDNAPAGRPRLRTAVLILAIGAVIAIGGALAIGSLFRSGGVVTPSMIDAARATSIAIDFYTGAHTQGATVSNVKVLSVTLGFDDHGEPAWKVNIVGDVTEAGQTTFAYMSAMWLYIDAHTGQVRIFAAG